MWQKLKSFLNNDALFHSVLLILVAIGSFGLGRQSLDNEAPSNGSVAIENQAPAAVVKAVSEAATTSAELPIVAMSNTEKVVVVGSKSGTKYHLPSCGGAKRIKPENLVTFDSIEAAKAAGYSAAVNCPGLK